MGFRRKVKDKLKSILRGTTPSQTSGTPAASVERPPNQPEPRMPVAAETVVPKPQVVSEGPKPSPATAASTVDDAKVAKHLLRTKRGLIKFIEKEGGTIELAKLHDHSEQRYFVGHRKFSDLMETMIEEEYLLFSWETQEATLTQRGREWALQK